MHVYELNAEKELMIVPEHNGISKLYVTHARFHLAVVVSTLTFKIPRLWIIIYPINLLGWITLSKRVHLNTTVTSEPILTFPVDVINWGAFS